MLDLFYLLLGGVLWNNVILTQLLGLSPFLVERERASVEDLWGMGMMTTALLVASAFLAFLAYDVVLLPLGLEFLDNLILIIIVFLLVLLFQQYKDEGERGKRWHLYLPDVFMNTAIFGVLLLNVAEWETLIEALVGAAGFGLGFAFMLVIVESFNKRLEKLPLPNWITGVPAQLITLGILALAVSGFNGL